MVEFFARGGLFHYSWQLAHGLVRAGNAAGPGLEVVLLTGPGPECDASPDPRLRLVPALGTWNPHRRPPVVPRRLLRAWRGVAYTAAWGRLLWIAARERPEAILLGDFEHRCDAWGVAQLRRWCDRHGARLGDVWHNPCAFERNRPGRLVRSPGWRAAMARRFDAVFVHGEALAAEWGRLTGAPAHAIAHGNENWLVEQAGPDPGLDARLDLPPGRPVALLFGALSAYKGVEDALRALALVPAARRPTLVIAGLPTAGVRPGAWRRQVEASGLAAWVRWDLRYVPVAEAAWYVRRADFAVLPYRAASQSGVAHLAITVGKPLLVTAVGGLPELIAGNGLVVPPGDAAALAAGLEQLAASPALRQRMGARSLELAHTRHDWEAIARAVLAGLGLDPASRIGTTAA